MTRQTKNVFAQIFTVLLTALRHTTILPMTHSRKDKTSDEPPSFKQTAVAPAVQQSKPSPLNGESINPSEPEAPQKISIQLTLKEWVDELSTKNLSAYEVADEIIIFVMSILGGPDEELCVNSISQALSDLLNLDPESFHGRMNNESIWTLLECFFAEVAFNRFCDHYREAYGLGGNSLNETVSHLNKKRDELKSIISKKVQPFKSNAPIAATVAIYSLLQIVVIYAICDVMPIKKTQSQLAREIGVSQQFISQFFLKKRTMSWKRAKLAASLTNTEPGWWCDGDIEKIKSVIMIE